MAPKKKTVEEGVIERDASVGSQLMQKVDEDVMKESFNKGAQLPVSKVTCGHINKQFVNSEGVREDLACTLPLGHSGDHFAMFPHLVTDYGTDKDGRQMVKGYHEEMAEGWWGDAAGALPQAVVTTPEQDFQRLQNARARERGTDPQVSERIDKEMQSTYGS